ncbi:MAG TPA: segregation/condensation protein A [Candidatus Kapabacteria bacterium]|nr:segregation/condensation protein A [Candidatus Kapabacteria bacterium]
MENVISPTYKIRLPLFEGPLDLLLFFIKRDELDIYDIPVHRITTEFLEYLKLMQALDLEVAGDFIVVAAELCQIKAKMLLPREERTEEGVEEDDPRADLVRRLIEYRRFKEMSEQLSSLNEEARKLHYRQYFKADDRSAFLEEEEDGNDLIGNITLFHLLAAFQKAMKRAPLIKRSHDVEMIPVTVEEQSEYILDMMALRGEMNFIDLFAEYIDANDVEQLSVPVRLRIVVTFMAILELIRSGMVTLRQSEAFDDIILFKP